MENDIHGNNNQKSRSRVGMLISDSRIQSKEKYQKKRMALIA